MSNQLKSRLTPLAAAAAATALLSAGPAGAQDDVAATKHNMSERAQNTQTGMVDYGEVCVYCHTPHGGPTSTNAPLWNRDFGTGPYNMYDNSWSSTIDMTVAASPQGVSLACLSCHDGTVGLDVVINPPNSYTGPAPSGTETLPPGLTNLETDLRNDHPISVTYNTADDPAFNAPDATGKIGGALPLYSGRVECGSCHNPHTTQNSPFLRLANTGSTLCKTCHIK